MPRESWYINESELDDFQVQIIQKPSDKSFIVQGCAGSGKTILALWKAKEIQESNRGSYFVIVFTKALRQFIDDGVRSIGLNTSRVVYYWQWDKRNSAMEADYIIVDEAQDFDKYEIEKLKNSARTAVIFYGDSAQQLYKGLKDHLLTIEQMSTLTNLQIYQLAFNHRLPKKIARFAEYISESDDELEMRCTKEGSEKPKVLHYDSWNQQMDSIMQTIRSKGLQDVGILFKSNAEVERAYNYYTGKGNQIEAKFDRDMQGTMNLNFTTDNPKLLTYWSAKGLQFEVVFIPDCTESDEKFRNPLYVAITRAYRDVFILYTGHSVSRFIEHVPRDLYITNGEKGETGITF